MFLKAPFPSQSSSWAPYLVKKILIVGARHLIAFRSIPVPVAGSESGLPDSVWFGPTELENNSKYEIRPKSESNLIGSTNESVPDVQTHVHQSLAVQFLPLLHGVEVVSDGRGLGLGDGPGVDHVPLVALLGVEGQPKADEGAINFEFEHYNE